VGAPAGVPASVSQGVDAAESCVGPEPIPGRGACVTGCDTILSSSELLQASLAVWLRSEA
jgi:hypothetical protein